MKKVFYEKRRNRYYPVAEHDSDFLSSFANGAHLVMCVPGGTSRKFNIDPAYAPMIAAGYVAKESMINAISKASELTHRSSNKFTKEQRAAWDAFIKVMGDGGRCLHYQSYNDIAEAGINTMIDEANKLLKHESVKAAYEHFLLMCKLTQETFTDE